MFLGLRLLHFFLLPGNFQHAEHILVEIAIQLIAFYIDKHHSGKNNRGKDKHQQLQSHDSLLSLSDIRHITHKLQQQTAQKSAFPDLAPEALAEAYPGRNQSLTQVLSSADSRLNGLSRQ